MSRGKTLISLVTDFRAECKLSQNPSHNNQTRDGDINLIQRVQEWLWEDYTWPHLRVERLVPVSAGQRYYSPPSDMKVDRIESIWFRDGDQWREVLPGISRENYNQVDSDLDVREWPVRRWKIAEGENNDGEQIELWPIPDADPDLPTLNGYLKIIGIRNLKPLVEDGDRADLDDRLITLYAAAERISDDKLSSKKLSLANKRLAALRGNLVPAKKFKMFGKSGKSEKLLRGPPTVYYRTTEG